MSGDSGRLNWFKSSYSGSQGDSCVEVAYGRGAGDGADVHVRDSKDKERRGVAFSPAAWVAFVARLPVPDA